MDIDIGFWLTLAVLVSGALWLADKKWRLREHTSKMVRETVEFTNSLLPVFLVVLLIRSFIVEPFTIPSGSMLPTLEVNDFILVNKFAYGLRLPVTNTRVVNIADPQRGDVMVFRYPLNRNQNFIKRVVGLPGDVVSQRDGRLLINGEPVEREAVDSRTAGRYREDLYIETLGEAVHMVRTESVVNRFTGQTLSRSEDNDWEVPEGHYFMVGDNRDNSSDSRMWGAVSEDLIVGKAFLIWMHWRPGLSLPSFSRNGAIDKVEVETQ